MTKKNIKNGNSFNDDWDRNVKTMFQNHNIEVITKSGIVEKINFLLNFLKKIDERIKKSQKIVRISIWFFLVVVFPLFLFELFFTIYFHFNP